MLKRNYDINREAVRVSYNTPRDSGQDKKNEIGNDLDPVLQRQRKSKSLDVKQAYRTDLPKAGKYDAVVKPFFPAAFATNLTMNALEVLEGTLAMRRSANHVTKLNTRLLESIPGGDIAFMNSCSRMMAMGANSNATCRLNHVSACHIAAMHDNDALDLLLRSGADISRSDKQGRTPLHLAAWAGHAKQIALLLNFPEALRRCVVDYVALSPEILEEVKRVSLPVNKLTNVPCRFNVESTLPDEWSDGVEHNCRNYKETLPLFQQGWTALHSASARAQHHCVQLLLAAGADASAQDLLCRTPLDVAGYAHYMGYNIDPKNFKETVNLLLKASDKIQKCCYKSNPLDTPLHTAVELESEEVVEKMLLAGASATAWNSQGLTAMHLCVKKRSKELLQLLANHKSGNDDPYLATVDVKDRAGSTVLCAAVKSEWLQGVCIALGAGASITMKTDGESPIHIAAQLGNIDILQEILTVAKYNSTVDFRNEKGETALFKAISHHQLDALKLLLGAGSSIEVEISDKANVFHVAAKYGNRDVLQYLLEYNSNITAKLIHRFDNMGPPLLYAVSNNHYCCAELLICKGAQVNAFLECRNFIDKDILNWTSLLHIAASKNYFEIADLIIKHDHETIHAVDSTGRTPLHEACYHGNREMIVLLLRKGADLSAASRNGITKPISILMNNLSKPTEFMQEIFDSYISSQGVSLQESNCEVVVDYGVLVPDKSNMKQMRVIKALVNTGNRYDQDRLLLHPLVQSFLYLKWKSLLPYFYSILVLHVCFVLSLNVYAISVFYYNDIKEPRSVPLVLRSDVWIHLIYLTVFLITIQEIIFIKIKSKRYLLFLETWLKFWSIALALVLPRVVSWETEYSPEWARLIATVALLLSWFEMMFLLSRFPNWGYYVLMFGKVSNKVFKILVSFVFLIFGFSVSFMIQCRAEPPFEGPWSAFVTTMVMMTSEFDYNDQLSKKSVNSSASTIILRLIFVSFLILVSIVLMNLLVGVAVNDVNNLEIIGSIKRLEKQVEFITSLEDIVFNKFIKKLVPKSLYKKWLKNKKWENVIVLRPRVATCRNCNRLPARLREAIFEKAQSQKKQSDDEQGTMLYQMKLDEIYKVIVQKNGGEPPKSESPDNALNKVIESIDKIRSDIELIKNYIDATKRRSLCSNKSVPLLVVSKNN